MLTAIYGMEEAKKDFKNASEIQKKTAVNFSKLLDLVASEFPKMRIRFTTSNPQDFHDEVFLP